MNKIYAQREGSWSENIHLHVIRTGSKERSIGLPVTFVPLDEGMAAYHQPPTVTIDSTAAQSLMDGLWECGFRPAQGSGSAGSLAATQNHLADMRAIVFSKLEIAAPSK
ncbi:MAG TPA: hypothetical protein VMF06_23240 [Candidatus Limnocylindria bacterium]|jgi:hypothetical protein|nr:hypothetical protein [Candidatus Limnocylindria bacterium]